MNKDNLTIEGFESFEEEGFEGKVKIFTEKNEQIIGIFVGPGRTIGEGSLENHTWGFVDVSTGELILLPGTTVLDKKIKMFAQNKTEKKENKTLQTVLIRYEGKQESKNGKSYHDFALLARSANDAEKQFLSVEQETKPFDLSSII